MSKRRRASVQKRAFLMSKKTKHWSFGKSRIFPSRSGAFLVVARANRIRRALMGGIEA